MSIKVMAMVWEFAPVGGSELLCLLALADYADDEGGSIFPSLDTLASKLRMSKRQTIRVVKRLESRRLVKVTERGGLRNGRNMPNQYRINVHTMVAAGLKRGTGSDKMSPRSDKMSPPCGKPGDNSKVVPDLSTDYPQNNPQGSDKMSPRSVADVTTVVSPVSPDPSVDPKSIDSDSISLSSVGRDRFFRGVPPEVHENMRAYAAEYMEKVRQRNV